MGMAWLSMSSGLVLVCQPMVPIVLELNSSGWRCVGLVVANTHKAEVGALGGLVVTNTSGETSVGTLQARGSH
jgi:hypothetical protein